jgi:uncharacterized protein
LISISCNSSKRRAGTAFELHSFDTIVRGVESLHETPPAAEPFLHREFRVARHDFNRLILQEVSHRPWPMPDKPWVMTQSWHDLLFAHWRVDHRTLRGKVPPEFELDVFDGASWLGIVPFHMTNVAPRGIPSLPWISEFPELNVRTYVRVDDRPGIYFFSLDAGSRLAVRAARAILNLPYHSASITVRLYGGRVEYESRRRGSGPQARLSVAYRPAGDRFQAFEGTLEHFLTERYCLYNLDREGVPYRLEIHHPPWPLQPAVADFAHNTMDDAAGLSAEDMKPLLHFSKRQDMVAWAPTVL